MLIKHFWGLFQKMLSIRQAEQNVHDAYKIKKV